MKSDSLGFSCNGGYRSYSWRRLGDWLKIAQGLLNGNNKGFLEMHKFKKFLMTVAFALVGVAAFAEDGEGFDPSTLLGSATTTVTTIATAVGALLAAAITIYLAFVGYRKAREALNKA